MSVSFLTIMKPKMNIPKHLKKPNTLGEMPVRTDQTLGLIPKTMTPRKNRSRLLKKPKTPVAE